MQLTGIINVQNEGQFIIIAVCMMATLNFLQSSKRIQKNAFLLLCSAITIFGHYFPSLHNELVWQG